MKTRLSLELDEHGDLNHDGEWYLCSDELVNYIDLPTPLPQRIDVVFSKRDSPDSFLLHMPSNKRDGYGMVDEVDGDIMYLTPAVDYCIKMLRKGYKYVRIEY